jgi:hypothetical protein
VIRSKLATGALVVGLIVGGAGIADAVMTNNTVSLQANSSNTINCPTALTNGKKSADSEIVKCAPAPVTTTTVPTGPTTTVPTQPPPTGSMAAYWEQFSNGPDPTGNPNYVMIGVWDQAPDRQEGGVDNAISYKALGINTDVNAYENAAGTFAKDSWPETGGMGGTGSDGLAAPYSFASDNNVGNFMDDEPDMNQVNEPANNQRTSDQWTKEAAAVDAADPTRPSAANFGKCVSLYVTEGQWPGCHLDNETPAQKTQLALIQQYCQNVDIPSSDYYGYTDPYEPAQYHGAWTYGTQVDGTRLACGPNKPVLGFVETGHPFNNAGAATIAPSDIQAALNVELVHGANGFLYFVHDFFKGGFTEDGLLTTEADAQPVVSSFNAEVAALAPWINQASSPSVTTATTGGIPVTTMLKTYNGHTYLFAAADGSVTLNNSGSTTATFTLPAGTYSATSAVYGETRSVDASSGTFSDSFTPYQLHVYELS